MPEFQIHIHHHFDPPLQSNGEVLQLLRKILTVGEKTMKTVQEVKDQADKVLAAVTDESSKDDAIITLVQGNTAMLASLKEQLAAAMASNDPAALQAVFDQLAAAEASAIANAAKVVEAVNAGTTT